MVDRRSPFPEKAKSGAHAMPSSEISTRIDAPGKAPPEMNVHCVPKLETLTAGPGPLSAGSGIKANKLPTSGAPTSQFAAKDIDVRPLTRTRMNSAATSITRWPPTLVNVVTDPQTAPPSTETSTVIDAPWKFPTTSMVLGLPMPEVLTATPGPLRTGSGRSKNRLPMGYSLVIEV
jgi:hypothetical protein